MIIFDTETTGLVKPVATPLKDQPQIIEFAAIKLDDQTLEEVDRLEFLCNPGISLPPEIIRITGLRDSDLAGKPAFGEYLPALRKFYLGERILIAHNLEFDRKMKGFELMRLDVLDKFPWPYHHICTVVETMSIKGHRLSMSKLYEYLFGEGFQGAHRAMVDVEALTRCVKCLIQKKIIELPTS